MTIKECIDIVDNIKPNQYSVSDKVRWLSFIDSTIINDVLKTHEGYDGRYDEFEGYSEDKTSVGLIVPSPYDRLYTAYLKMKIDGENGETARYNNSAAEFNAYLMEYRKYYHKTHMPLDPTRAKKPTPPKKTSGISDAEFENLKRELYYLLSEDFAKVTSHDKLYDIVTEYAMNHVEMLKGKDGYTPLKGVDYFDGEKGDKGDDYILTETDKGEIANDVTKLIQTKDGTIVSQNADFAEVAEWGDGNPNNEDRTGYFVCADVPVNGIVMRKATSTDDVKGVSILAPAFAGNYSKDKLDSNGNLLPKYSYVAIIGFVPVRDNGTCTVGGRCMPDDNGCAIPSSNNMGYQVVNRIDENRVLIIIEPNGDMVQKVKTKIVELQEGKANLQLKKLDITEYAVMSDLLIGTHIYELKTIILSSGDYNLTFTNGSRIITAPNEAFKEGKKYLITAHMENDIGWVFDVVAEVIDLEDKVNVADIDQSFNPESENAQSGKAVAEALKSKVLVDVTITEEQAGTGVTGISVAIDDIEAYHNAKQVNIYVEMPFKDKALPSSTIAINVSDGAAYADYYGWQHGVTCPQGNTLYWHIFNVRESFHKSNGKKNMCSYYRAPVYYEGPNSLGTCSCLYGEVVHLANLKNHPPKLNLYWSSGGATLEAGTRIFVEVYE